MLFTGLPINPDLLGNTSMVVRRKQPITGHTVGQCPQGVPAEIVTFSLTSVNPVTFGGARYHVVVTLPQDGSLPPGTVGYQKVDVHAPPGFFCFDEFEFSATLSPVGGGAALPTFLHAGKFGKLTTDAVISTDPPPDAVIVPGPPGPLGVNANVHNPLPSGFNDVFFLRLVGFEAHSAVHTQILRYHGTFVVNTPDAVNEIRSGDRFEVGFSIDHKARDSDARVTRGEFRTDGPDIFELRPPARLNSLTIERQDAFTEVITRNKMSGGPSEDGLAYFASLQGDSVLTSPFFPTVTFEPSRFGMDFATDHSEERLSDQGLGQTLSEQLLSPNGVFQPELFQFQDGFIEFSNSDRTQTVAVGGVMDNVQIIPAAAIPFQVTIDITPDEFPIRINPRGGKKIRVELVSTATFDAPAEVDPGSLTFGATGDEQSLDSCKIRHAKKPDRRSLECRFSISQTDISIGDTIAVLKGRTRDGVPIIGGHSIVTVSRDR